MSDDDKIIPFGKYKGQEIVQVMARDPQYVQWLTQQAWFGEKFAPIYQVIVNQFAAPSEDTPAHNAMQVRFLDADYCAAFWRKADLVTDPMREWLRDQFRRNTKYKHPAPPVPEMTTRIGKAKFEDASDVVMPVALAVGEDAYRQFYFAIEIKPCVGDDYPAVLRQIKAQQIAARGGDTFPTHWFLLIDQFDASNVTLDQVRQIFAHDNIRVVLAAEIA